MLLTTVYLLYSMFSIILAHAQYCKALLHGGKSKQIFFFYQFERSRLRGSYAMSKKFEIGDLVWAKMKGFPYWPAQIAKPTGISKKTTKNSYWIYFFGTGDYGWIDVNQLDRFHENRLKHSDSNFRNFKSALKCIEEYIEAKRVNPNYELDLPVPIVATKAKTDGAKKTKTDNEETPKKVKKTVKRLSKDSSTPKYEKKRRMSASFGKFEENGSHAEGLTDEIPDSLDGEYRDSPTLDDEQNDSLKEKAEAPSSLALGFIGLGVMGTGIVKNLINSGHRVNLWNRTIEKCKKIKEEHQSSLVSYYETPCEVVLNSDVIFSCVADANAAGQILFGNFGVLTVSLEGKGYVEMSGIDPDTSVNFCKSIQKKGGRYLEAQLQGSKTEAELSKLVVLSAGDHSLFLKCQTCFKAMGQTAFYLGNVGFAAKMNMVINLINSIAMVGLTEAFGLADRSGLSSKNVLEILNVTNVACPYLIGKAERIVKKDFQEPEHALEHMQKDIKLCLDMSNNLKQPLMMASTANEILKHARRLGFDGQDCSCVFMKSKF